MTLTFVFRQFCSHGEARHWPLALGWVSEDDRHTKPLHWVSEPWVWSTAHCLPGVRLSHYERSAILRMSAHAN